jgi:hypothetical protein
LVQAVATLHPFASQETRNDVVLACWSVVHGFALLQMDGAFASTVGIADPEYQLRRTLALTVCATATVHPGPHGVAGS